MTKQLPASAMADRMIGAGVTRERAKARFETLFARHGHFSSHRKQQIGMDALKLIAYFR